MTPSPRAETLRLLRTDEALPPPSVPDIEPNSPEALAFLRTTKEAHYANLARTLDLLFDEMADLRSRPSQELTAIRQGAIIERVGWQKLSLDLRDVFIVARNRIRNSPTYKNTELYTQMVGRLDRARWIDLDCQIDGGAGTGISSVLTILRNAPSIIRHYDATSSDADIRNIIRHPHSTVLLRRMAKRSVNQLMASQSALVGETRRHNWCSIDKILDPRHFKLEQMTAGGHALAYADFDGLTVPAGYTPHYTVKPTREVTRVSEIPAHQKKVIGCPVTLLHGRLAELMQWSVDMVEERELWNEEWPPKQKA